MNAHLRYFWIALQFLTRVPVPAHAPPEPGEAGRVVLYYPLVGLAIGGLLWLVAGLLGDVEPLVRAAVLLAVWVGVTGGLHLDGLADTADAFVGGHGDRERTLAIMKDPYCGPMGVTAIGLVLLVKFAVLAMLPSALLWLVPLLGRSLIPALFLNTPYVRPGGLGEAMQAELPPSAARGVLVAVGLFALLFFGGAGLWALLVAAFWWFVFRAWLLGRLGGTTGDTAGALVEIGESLVLLALA